MKSENTADDGARERREGFTLVELLVVIGVIAVLMALTLPALRSVRLRADEAVALSNLRGIGVTIEVYANTQRNAYPFNVPGAWFPDDPEVNGGSISTSDPWAISYLWPSLLPIVAPWREHYASWLDVGVVVEDPARPWNGTTVSYRYSNSFIARPEMWSDQPAAPAEQGGGLFAPTFTHEVRAPALKALMYDSDRAYLRREATRDDRRGVLTADGAAALRLDSGALKPVHNRYDDTPPRPFHDTRDGVRGRDFN